MRRDKDEFNVGRAIQIRRQKALEGFDKKQALRDLAKKIADRTLGRGVEEMRQLGGFSAVARELLGPAPEAGSNSLGIATSDAWYRWEYVSSNLQDAIFIAKTINNARVEIS